ncbi:dTDP-glucose 4-6-dehydratase [Halorubrum sp. AJ67]|nr:dTDP-glucose 4-6-dehydratase [Halorubrum sp. AJ67]
MRAITRIHRITVSVAYIGFGTLSRDKYLLIEELAELVVDVVETDSDIVYEDLPVEDPQVRQPDISRAKERLDRTPR